MDEHERLEKAKIEEERIQRAFTKKKPTVIYGTPKVNNAPIIAQPKKETKKSFSHNIQSNVITDDVIEEQITYTTVEQDHKKITKKLIKKLIKKKTSTIDEKINQDEIDWNIGDPCISFYKTDQRWHHAKIKKATEYGSFWIIFEHDHKEQDTIRTALKPILGHQYKMISERKEESEVSEGNH